MSPKVFALLLAVLLAFLLARTYTTPVGISTFTQRTLPLGRVGQYIPDPSTYDDSLCATFARMSKSSLDAPALKMGCPEPLVGNEVDAAHKFLTQAIMENTAHTAFGKLGLMDLTGHVSRGEEVQYFELTAMLYNYTRSFSTPILVEMFRSRKGFEVKRIKTKVCGMQSAYAARPAPRAVKAEAVANVGYPKELDTVIEQLVQAQRANVVSPMLPGVEPIGLGGQKLGQGFETPSQVARRLHG